MRSAALWGMLTTSVALAAPLGVDANHNGLWDDGDALLKIVPVAQRHAAGTVLRAYQQAITVSAPLDGLMSVTPAQIAPLRRAAGTLVAAEACFEKTYGKGAFAQLSRVTTQFWNPREDAFAIFEDILNQEDYVWTAPAKVNCASYR